MYFLGSDNSWIYEMKRFVVYTVLCLLSYFLLLGTLFLLVLLMTKSGAGSRFLNTLCLNFMS